MWTGSRETKFTYWFVRAAIRPSLGAGVNVSAAQANRKGDEIAQVASDYSPVELAYFKVLVCLCRRPLFKSPSDVSTVISGGDDRHSS